MYVDDIIIYVVGNIVDEIIIGLQVVLDQVNFWCFSNRLILYEGKFEVMVLSIIFFIGFLKQLKWGMDIIWYVFFINCFGVIIDDKFFWFQYVVLVRFVFNVKVKMLRCINFLCIFILEIFYYRIVILSVLYGIVIWGFGFKFKDLEMIYIRVVRLIYKILNSFGDNDVFFKVGWMFLEYFYKLCILIIIYNVYYNLGLWEINCLVIKNFNSYNLRKFLNVVFNRFKIELGCRFFVYRFVVVWNVFFDNVKDFLNLFIFKYNLK